jgi:acetoin utilization protein AcuB
MYIGRIMHTDLITVTPETSIADARDLVEEKKIDHLLVVDRHNKLAGIVSDRDLKQYWASPATSLSVHELNYLLQKVVVKTIMTKAVVTVSPDTTIERAAYIMQTQDISSLPVMEGENLVGIVTSTDVMAVLLEAIGISDDSVRLGIFVRDSIGALAEVAGLLKQKDINIQSLFCWPEKNYPGVTQLVVRVAAGDGDKAIKALTGGGFKVKTRYEKDIVPFLPVGK